MIWSCSIRNCHLKVARVVAGIENTENVDTVICSSFYEFINNIISIVAVTEKVLSAQKHHNFCVWHCSMELSKAFPWIFIQEADTRVISCSTPSFCSPVTNLVDFWSDWQHVSCRHASSVKRLCSITQNKFRNTNFFCHFVKYL